MSRSEIFAFLDKLASGGVTERSLMAAQLYRTTSIPPVASRAWVNEWYSRRERIEAHRAARAA